MRKTLPEPDDVPVPRRYTEEATRPDAEVTVRDRLPGKLRRIAGDHRLVKLVREVYGYVTDPRVPHGYKVLAVASLLYFITPFDAIPDWIPGAGYLDDAGALAALVVAVRKIIDAAREATLEVASRAIAETEEAWARRGVSQVCLSLWASTLAACVGLVYYAARTTALTPGTAAGPFGDPFFWACTLTAIFGLATSIHFARRVWRAYQAAPPRVREPLAWAIVSLADWRQIALLSIPVVALVVIVVVRAVLELGR